jgi:hypothetical protein
MTKPVICPLMSCRTTSVDSAHDTGNPPKITPTVAKCQEKDCALWDFAEKVCCFKSIAMQLIKLNEKG